MNRISEKIYLTLTPPAEEENSSIQQKLLTALSDLIIFTLVRGKEYDVNRGIIVPINSLAAYLNPILFFVVRTPYVLCHIIAQAYHLLINISFYSHSAQAYVSKSTYSR